MTQELVIGILLLGFLGLVWAMTMAILSDAPPVRKEGEDADSPALADQEHHKLSTARQETFAA